MTGESIEFVERRAMIRGLRPRRLEVEMPVEGHERQRMLQFGGRLAPERKRRAVMVEDVDVGQTAGDGSGDAVHVGKSQGGMADGEDSL